MASTMNARDQEQIMLDTCKQITTSGCVVRLDNKQANVVNVAAMLCSSAAPALSNQLLDAANNYFNNHPLERLSTQEVLRRRWIINLPRFRSMLEKQLTF